jgi:UDP-N-acetylmuramoyl-tripeptide--D-alanyl-D-alanine ligase
MYSLTVEQLCQVADGLIVGDLDLTTQIDNVVIDSRQASAGSLFVALQGSRSHGIEFAQQAGNQGAVVLVDGAQTDRCPVPCVAVPDAADALALLANHNRRQSEALVIAVTGSVGKTTTRRCVASVLSQTHNGIESPRNFNNLLGLPLSLLQLSPDSDYAVVELGA